MDKKNTTKLKDMSPEMRDKILDIITYRMQDKINERTMKKESTHIPIRNIAIKLWDDVRRRAIEKFVFEDYEVLESQASFLLNRNKFIESIFSHMLEDQDFCDQFVNIIMEELFEIGKQKGEDKFYINPDLL